jgi:autotransporter-associated beta strand protein
MKTGPGELILTNPNTPVGNVHVFEGTLTFDSIADSWVNSPLGSDSWILLGDATLRYVGTEPLGHSTDRQIRLRGFGVVEASGKGPLRLTATDIVATPGGAYNQVFTLSGKGEGFVEGRLNLLGGRLRKRGVGTWTIAQGSEIPNIIWGAEIFEGKLVLDGVLGRDVTVHAGGTLAGSGRVKRDLILEQGATLALDPWALKELEVGKNIYIAGGAMLSLPRKLPSEFTPVLRVGGKFVGEFTDTPPHAYVKYDHENGLFCVRHRPVGTLLIMK